MKLSVCCADKHKKALLFYRETFKSLDFGAEVYRFKVCQNRCRHHRKVDSEGRSHSIQVERGGMQESERDGGDDFRQG